MTKHDVSGCKQQRKQNQERQTHRDWGSARQRRRERNALTIYSCFHMACHSLSTSVSSCTSGGSVLLIVSRDLEKKTTDHYIKCNTLVNTITHYKTNITDLVFQSYAHTTLWADHHFLNLHKSSTSISLIWKPKNMPNRSCKCMIKDFD